MNESAMNGSPNVKTPGRSYAQAVRGLRPLLGLALLFSALVNILLLTGSVYMLQVYDRVLSSGSIPTLIGLFAIVVVLYCFLGFYDFTRMRLLSRAGLRLDEELGERAFSKSLSERKILGDLDMVRNSLSSPAIITLFDLPFVPLFLGLLFVLHPWLGWLTLAGAGIACLIAAGTRSLNKRAVERARVSESETHALESAGHRASETVLALGLANPLAQQWRLHRNKQNHALQSGGDPAEMLAAASRAFRMLLQSMILSVGAYLVIKGDLSAGMIIASSILSGRALTPIDQIATQAPALISAHAAHKRLITSLPEEEATPSVALPRPKGHVSVDALAQLVPVAPGLTPRPEQPKILSDITFALEPGDVLGVVGASGSGKSTLARLLIGAIEADSGSMRIDGATLDQWSDKQRSTFLGYLPQRVEMLPGSVRDNIARFDPDATDEEVIAAAQLAGVHDIILKLPDGYGCSISDVGLSGGQMQRIALARAVFGNPAVLVLDEPNSNLDRLGEIALINTIEKLSEAGATVILIAHRTEALRCLTKLLIMKDGQIDAFGPVQEVLDGHDRSTSDAEALPQNIPAKAPASVSAKTSASAPAKAPVNIPVNVPESAPAKVSTNAARAAAMVRPQAVKSVTKSAEVPLQPQFEAANTSTSPAANSPKKSVKGAHLRPVGRKSAVKRAASV